MMSLEDKSWKEYQVETIFEIFNSAPYHKNDLNLYSGDGTPVPYLSRTNTNNGLKDVVTKFDNHKLNPQNTIVFGAENATFFYQPYKHITGNKMYVMQSENITDRYIGLFLKQLLNSSVKYCGFSYGQGLTGTREKRRGLMLPVNSDDQPDWEYMEEYAKELETQKLEKYLRYLAGKVEALEYVEIDKLEEKEWEEFFLNTIFTSIRRGKRLTKANQTEGTVPYISSTAMNNGVDNFIEYKAGMRTYENCLSLANSGSVGACFYEPYEFIASDHITHLKNDDFNPYIYLFIASILNRLSDKYNFNREINDTRLSREKILLPIDDEGSPDYDYMEQFAKNLMLEKYNKYINYISKRVP